MRLLLPIVCVGAACLLSACKPPAPPPRGKNPLPQGVETTDQPPGKVGGTFVYTLPSEPRTFNALIAEDAYAAQLIDLMLPGLITQDPFTQQPKGALAEGWEVLPDHKSYLVHLRKGLRWSDGEPFTADDVIFSFGVIFADTQDPATGETVPKVPNRYRQQFTIGGQPLRFEKIDDWTVRFETAVPYAPFLNDLGFVSILPKHKLARFVEDGTFKSQWSNQTAMDDPAQIVTMGPFRIHSYRPGERIVLEPNPHYWRADKNGQRLPYINYLIVKFVPDANTGLLLFATGQSDAQLLAPSEVAWVEKNASTYEFTVYNRGPDSSIFFIFFNLKTGVNAQGKPYGDPVKFKWFSDVRFRRAVQRSIDRPGIIRAVFFGDGTPLNSIISASNGKWHNPNTVKYPYDVEKARAELAEAGFRLGPDGKLRDAEGHPVNFELLVSDGSERSAKMATTFMDNLKALGIELRLSYIDFGTLISRVSNTFDFDATFMGLTGGGDPSGGKSVYCSDGRMHLWNPSQKTPATAWEKRVDELFAASETEFDEAKRIRLIYQMQDIFAEELPLIFLVTPTEFMGLKNHWQGVRPPPIGSLLWNLDELWERPAP